MAIRTPDQRVRVFVSSTLQELAEERQAVRDAIEALHLTPVMFEQGARPHPPRSLYRAYLEQSDVFVGLYWERYGWVAPGEEISGLEDEYNLSGERPKLIYIKAPALKREPRLAELIERIRNDDRVSYRAFANPDDLRSLVAEDLAVILTERFSASAPRPAAPEGLSPLPRPPTPLVGREEDVARLVDQLADSNTRLVTIFGTGGVGKSRLAIAVADQARDRYTGGVVYVDLAAVSEPSLLLPTIARALGVQEAAGASIATQLRARLADARTLIVLDNMEQLTDAAADIADLLAGTDAVQVLVTSRRLLDIRGEHVYELEPLAVSGREGAVTPAVELFLERARAIRPEFQPRDEELAAIGEICRRLDGLPLAIELASARLRIFSPATILERMGHRRLAFLRVGGRDLPRRQRTLRDAIAWSHSLLSPDSHKLFGRLSAFVGSAALEAIEEVANPDGSLDTVDILADLVDQSLIRAIAEAEPRFGMLETIREFAVEQLEASGEAVECRARHEAYYLELAERGQAGLGTAEQVDWLDRYGRENDNFRAVLRRALRRDNAPTAVRMGRALATYWYMCGSHSEGRNWMEQVAALPSAAPRERAAAWTIGAIQAFWQGDSELLETGLDDALRLLGEVDDQRTVAFAQLLQAMATGEETDDKRSQKAISEASRRLAAEGEPLAVAFGLLARSYLARLHGQMHEAYELAQAAHDLSVPIGESFVRMIAASELARADLELGDARAAQRHAVESLLAAQRLRNLNVVSYALELWATGELRDGRIGRAGQLAALAERGYHEAGSHPWVRRRTDAGLHNQLYLGLRAALGNRYQQLHAEARDADFDQAIAELIRSQPSGE